MIDPLILARFVHMAATVLACGSVSFMVLVADVPALHRRLRLMVWAALVIAILSGLGWLVLLASDILGAPIVDVCLHGGVWSVATDTRFGVVWCARLFLAISLGLLMLAPRARLLQLVAAALLIGLLALIGHAGATPGLAGRIHLVSDMFHLLAVGAWLGALPALALLLAQAGRVHDAAWSAIAVAAAERFSKLGIVCVATVLASGAVNSWNLLAGPRDLVATDYGRLVLLKIGLFAAMLAVATVNRYYLSPQLPAPGAMRALKRNCLGEIALGLCVLLFVGALGTLAPTAHVHSSSADIPADAAFVHIHTEAAMADVTIDPGRAGTVKATIRVSREDFSDFAAKEVGLALDPPGAGIKTVERATLRMPDGTWQADNIALPKPGVWTARVIVVPETGIPIVLDAPIVIMQCSNEC